MKRVLVTGAGGFIGHHLVKALVGRGCWVRGVDIKRPEFEPTAAHEFLQTDLRQRWAALEATYGGIDQVYALAANMGGIGFIESHKAEIVHDNTYITLNTLEAARVVGVQRLFFASSACVYPQYLQGTPDTAPLSEDEAYPADPEDGYGWEKLYAERLCRHYREDFGLETRVARFHNIYGPLGTYAGGREKSPAALCRKIALAPDGGTIDIWGDGQQTRSYCYIDDCVEGILRLMESDDPQPINIGRDDLISINQLADTIAGIAGKSITKRYDLTRPTGVRGRNSDNSRCRQVLGWEPAIDLETGLKATYHWIRNELIHTERLEIHEPA